MMELAAFDINEGLTDEQRERVKQLSDRYNAAMQSTTPEQRRAVQTLVIAVQLVQQAMAQGVADLDLNTAITLVLQLHAHAAADLGEIGGAMFHSGPVKYDA